MTNGGEVEALLRCEQFPRASGYSAEWVLANQMGLHPLWLTEWISQAMDVSPGMRILDLGCGKALSSIYFGTDDLYLNYLHRFVRPGGQIGIAVPGFMRELDGPLPEHLLPFWAQECWTWHTPAWWRRHWERTGLVDVQVVDALPNGHELWRRWYEARREAGDTRESLLSDIRVLTEDRGEYMGFVRMVARRRGGPHGDTAR